MKKEITFESWFEKQYGRKWDREEFIITHQDDITCMIQYDEYTRDEAISSIIQNLFDEWGSQTR